MRFRQFTAILILVLVAPVQVTGLSGLTAKNLWVFELVHLVPGILLIMLFKFFSKRHPGRNLTTLLKDKFGAPIGSLVALLYFLYLFITASLTLGSLNSYVSIDILDENPIPVIGFIALLLTGYVIFRGIGSLGGLSPYLAVISLSSVLFILVMVVANGDMNTGRLQPIMETGIGSILNTHTPALVFMRYDILIALFLFLADTQANKKTYRWTYAALIITAVIRSALAFAGVAVLGENVYAKTIEPVTLLAGTVDIGWIFQGMGAFAFIYAILPLLVKMALMLYTVVHGISHLFEIHRKVIIIPLTAATLLTSFLISRNLIGEIGLDNSTLLMIFQGVMLVVIPLVMVCMPGRTKNQG